MSQSLNQINQNQDSMIRKGPETYQDRGTQPSVTVKPVQFQNFDEPQILQSSSSLDLILDVPLEITVELGRQARP